MDISTPGSFLKLLMTKSTRSAFLFILTFYAIQISGQVIIVELTGSDKSIFKLSPIYKRLHYFEKTDAR